jgi:hypothetical protein
MTANELADAVEGAGDNSFNDQAARMLRKQAREIEVLKLRELSDEQIAYITKKYFNIHPEAKLSEQFKIKLYELEDFARAILKKEII